MTGEASGRNRRDPVRTRRVLLDAAADAVATHGVGVSFDAIARRAGVSKSGLLHHFASKDELFAALASDAYQRFTHDVSAHTEPADLAPGRVMRGYIRAAFSSLRSDSATTDYWAIEQQLSVIPAVADAIRANVATWEEDLTADGFDHDAMRLILLAVTGAELAAGVDALPGDASDLEHQLLRLTHQVERLTTLLESSP